MLKKETEQVQPKVLHNLTKLSIFLRTYIASCIYKYSKQYDSLTCLQTNSSGRHLHLCWICRLSGSCDMHVWPFHSLLIMKLPLTSGWSFNLFNLGHKLQTATAWVISKLAVSPWRRCWVDIKDASKETQYMKWAGKKNYIGRTPNITGINAEVCRYLRNTNKTSTCPPWSDGCG